MRPTVFRPLLVLAPALWGSALIAAAFIASRPTVGLAAYGFSAAVYEVGSLVCHQLPGRSFHPWGAQLAVCARCAGLYAGAAVAALGTVTLSNSALDRKVWHRAKELLVVAAVPTAATLIYEWGTGHMPSHVLRAAAGFLLGAIVMLVVLAASSSESAVEIH
jgi:uncharacterized membrane protein